MRGPDGSTDHLFEGENPTTLFAADARHWIAVYRHMIGFEHDILDRARARIRSLPTSARVDVAGDEVGEIEHRLQRHERRLEFWYARHWQLEGLEIDHGLRTVGHRDRTVNLTKREFQLLTLLAARSPEFVTPQQLLAEAWHNPRLPEEALRTYIARVRIKLGRLGVSAEVKNRPRQGYALLFEDRPNGNSDSPD